MTEFTLQLFSFQTFCCCSVTQRLNMPPCSVSGCTSGRKGFEKVQTFRYPSDDVMKKKWLKLIGRTTVGKDAVVCKKHFPLGYLKQKPKHPFASLSPNAEPYLAFQIRGCS